MTTDRKVRGLYEDVGELVAEHEGDHDTEELSAYRDDPVGFIRDVLGAEPWRAQREVAEAVRDEPLVALRSCNGTGKDWLTARLALWWCYSVGGLCVLTSATEQQVSETLMRKELHQAFRGSGLPGSLHVRALRPAGRGRAGVVAKTASAVSALTGLHEARVLFCISEAQHEGLDIAFDAAFANAVGEGDRIFAYGNPTRKAGPFYRACSNPDWHDLRISARDVPNVAQGETVIPGLITQAGVQRIASQYGEDSSFYVSRVEGRFPESDEEGLIRRSWIERSVANRKKAAEGDALDFHADGADIVVAVDPARAGPDATACCIREGKVVRDIRTWHTDDTMETVEKIRSLLRELAGPDAPRIDRVVIDEIGVGGGVVDRLTEALKGVEFEHRGISKRRSRRRRRRVTASEVDVDGFNSSRKADDSERFANLRAAAYWRVRTRLEEYDLLLPPDDPELREELAEVRWQVTGSGQVQIEDKEGLKARLGRSPDRADSLAMSLAPEVAPGASSEWAGFR